MKNGSGCILIIVAICFGPTVGGLMIEDIIETWAEFGRGHPVDVPFLPCAAVGIFVGWNLAIPVWLFTVLLVPLL